MERVADDSRYHPWSDGMELEFHTVCIGGNGMTIQEIKENYIKRYPDGQFFDEEIMKRYGESIDRMRVTGKGVMSTRNFGDVIAWEVVATQRGVIGESEVKYYFDVDTYEMFLPA